MKMMARYLLVLGTFLSGGWAFTEASRGEEQGMKVEQKCIGIIGGTSWESTALYYKLINQAVRERLGGLNSAKILLYSVNYDPIVRLERDGKWEEVGCQLATAAKRLQDAGADFVLLCCNTLHKAANHIEEAIDIPFLHIADAAGKVLAADHFHKIGLLGTQCTMEDGFYSSRLQENFGFEVIVPGLCDRKEIDRIIYEELCQGKVLPESKKKLIRVIADLQNSGAKAVLLGCTELCLLVSSQDVAIPTFDTTVLHANEAVRLSLA